MCMIKCTSILQSNFLFHHEQQIHLYFLRCWRYKAHWKAVLIGWTRLKVLGNCFHSCFLCYNAAKLSVWALFGLIGTIMWVAAIVAFVIFRLEGCSLGHSPPGWSKIPKCYFHMGMSLSNCVWIVKSCRADWWRPCWSLAMAKKTHCCISPDHACWKI